MSFDANHASGNPWDRSRPLDGPESAWCWSICRSEGLLGSAFRSEILTELRKIVTCSDDERLKIMAARAVIAADALDLRHQALELSRERLQKLKVADEFATGQGCDPRAAEAALRAAAEAVAGDWGEPSDE